MYSPKYKPISLFILQFSGKCVYRTSLTLCVIIGWPRIFQVMGYGKKFLSCIWVNSRFAIYGYLIVTVSIFKMWHHVFCLVCGVWCLFFWFVCVFLFILSFSCLFVYSFFLSSIHSLTLSSLVSDSTALNYRMIIEQLIRRRDVKRNSCDLTWDTTV